MDDVQAQVLAVRLHDLLGLVVAQQAVIHKDAGQLARLPSLVDDGAGHGGLPAAANNEYFAHMIFLHFLCFLFFGDIVLLSI